LAISWSLPLQFCGTRPPARRASAGAKRKGGVLANRGSQGARRAHKDCSACVSLELGRGWLLVNENSPQDAPCPGEAGAKSSRCHRIAGSGKFGGKRKLVAYPRLGASAALGIDPDVLQRIGSVSKDAENGEFGLWVLGWVGLLTSAMILPFWGSSRYLASCLWGHMSVSRNCRCGPLSGVVLVVLVVPVCSVLVRSR